MFVCLVFLFVCLFLFVFCLFVCLFVLFLTTVWVNGRALLTNLVFFLFVLFLFLFLFCFCLCCVSFFVLFLFCFLCFVCVFVFAVVVVVVIVVYLIFLLLTIMCCYYVTFTNLMSTCQSAFSLRDTVALMFRNSCPLDVSTHLGMYWKKRAIAIILWYQLDVWGAIFKTVSCITYGLGDLSSKIKQIYNSGKFPTPVVDMQW